MARSMTGSLLAVQHARDVVAYWRVGLAIEAQPDDGVVVGVKFVDVELEPLPHFFHEFEGLGEEVAGVDEDDRDVWHNLRGQVNGA